MFSKVYKQKFFSSSATDKKAQALENIRVFRKLAFKGSSRNSAIKDIEDIGKDKRMQWRALQDREKAYQAYQGMPGHARIPKKKKHSMFSRAYAKRTIFDHNSLILLGSFITP